MTVPVLHDPSRCPCGSGAAYADCCGALHRGRGAEGATAPTAERLMRSRFSAFAVADVPYLLETWHPSTRPKALSLDPGLQWRRLEIVATTRGGVDDDAGTVEFVAHYWDAAAGRGGQQHEDSVFVREAGRWLYVMPAP